MRSASAMNLGTELLACCLSTRMTPTPAYALLVPKGMKGKALGDLELVKKSGFSKERDRQRKAAVCVVIQSVYYAAGVRVAA
jgi:hypothetical protein